MHAVTVISTSNLPNRVAGERFGLEGAIVIWIVSYLGMSIPFDARSGILVPAARERSRPSRRNWAGSRPGYPGAPVSTAVRISETVLPASPSR